jgi:hypothetical protein
LVAQTGQQSQERSSLRRAGSEASGAVRCAALIRVHHFRFGFSAACSIRIANFAPGVGVYDDRTAEIADINRAADTLPA